MQSMSSVVWDLKSESKQLPDIGVFDCYIAEWLLSDGLYSPTQEAAFKKYNVSSLDDLATKQQEKLDDLPKVLKLFHDIEMPLVRVLWQMERNGITLDTACLNQVGKDLDIAISELEVDIKKVVEGEINLNSPTQVGTYLAEKVGVPLSKTKTGKYATNEGELTQYAEKFPVITQILHYRELSKLRSTYIDALISKVDSESRVHTTYQQVAASTGRLASANPNLQNIPASSEFGLKIRACFVAAKGKKLLTFDYSQQELRILAHLSGEEKLIEAFRNNEDVHTLTASQIFSISPKQVTKQQRMIAKTINFGVIYGMSSFGMSTGLNIPVEEAQKFITEFYKNYPKIKPYFESYISQGKKDGYVETLLGRRRSVYLYPGQKFVDNATRRVLLNFPIQGSAADMMKKAMIQIQAEVLDHDNSVKLLLQIHDELVFEIDDNEKEIKEVVSKVKHIMCGVYDLAVPIEVDVKIGDKWGELEKI